MWTLNKPYEREKGEKMSSKLVKALEELLEEVKEAEGMAGSLGNLEQWESVYHHTMAFRRNVAVKLDKERYEHHRTIVNVPPMDSETTPKKSKKNKTKIEKGDKSTKKKATK